MRIKLLLASTLALSLLNHSAFACDSSDSDSDDYCRVRKSACRLGLHIPVHHRHDPCAPQPAAPQGGAVSPAVTPPQGFAVPAEFDTFDGSLRDYFAALDKILHKICDEAGLGRKVHSTVHALAGHACRKDGVDPLRASGFQAPYSEKGFQNPLRAAFYGLFKMLQDQIIKDKGDNEALKKQLDALQQQVDRQKADATTLSEKVVNLVQGLGTLEGRVSTVERSSGAQDDSLQLLSSKLNEESSKVMVLGTKVAGLDNTQAEEAKKAAQAAQVAAETAQRGAEAARGAAERDATYAGIARDDAQGLVRTAKEDAQRLVDTATRTVQDTNASTQQSVAKFDLNLKACLACFNGATQAQKSAEDAQKGAEVIQESLEELQATIEQAVQVDLADTLALKQKTTAIRKAAEDAAKLAANAQGAAQEAATKTAADLLKVTDALKAQPSTSITAQDLVFLATVQGMVTSLQSTVSDLQAQLDLIKKQTVPIVTM